MIAITHIVGAAENGAIGKGNAIPSWLRSDLQCFEDFTLHGYDPHPHIKAEVAV